MAKKIREGNVDGRPRKQESLDFDLIKNLCNIGCTMPEIESVLSVSHDTIDRALKTKFNMGFTEFFAENSNKFKSSLRRMQYLSASGEYDGDKEKYKIYPSVAMQIWLGKQYLNQSDKQEIQQNEISNIPLFEWADAEDVTGQKSIEKKKTDNDEEDKEESSV